MTQNRPVSAKKPSREELEALFIHQRLTRGEIAEKLGVTDNVVKSWINSYKLRKGEQPPNRISREKLEEMYITQDLTMTQIAEQTGISRNTINTWCQRYKLRKKPGDPKRVSWLDEEGDAVSHPEKAPQAEPATQIVLNPRKPRRRKTTPLTTPATPQQLAEAGTILATIKAQPNTVDQLLLRRAVHDFKLWLQFRKEGMTL